MKHSLPDWKHLIPENFSDNSRVWIYQSNRMFGFQEALQIESILEDFVENWKSHGDEVHGYASLIFGQFIVLIADESDTQVSGCSTDSSVRVIKEIETLFNVTLFDRLLLAYEHKGRIQMLPMSQLNYALSNNYISESSLFFNNTVKTKKELLESWILPVKESWLNSRLSLDKA